MPGRDIRAQFRAATDPAQWALIGISAGGYCAAKLGLHHPAQWGAVIALDGYFLPSDGDAQSVINRNIALAGNNNPIETAASIPSGASPLPAFYLAVGTGNTDDVDEEKMFVAALGRLEQVEVDKLQGGQHRPATAVSAAKGRATSRDLVRGRSLTAASVRTPGPPHTG